MALGTTVGFRNERFHIFKCVSERIFYNSAVIAPLFVRFIFLFLFFLCTNTPSTHFVFETSIDSEENVGLERRNKRKKRDRPFGFLETRRRVLAALRIAGQDRKRVVYAENVFCPKRPDVRTGVQRAQPVNQ